MRGSRFQADLFRFPFLFPSAYRPIVNDVVITGMGVMCPLGVSPTAAWESIAQSRSGVRVRQDLALSLIHI